MEENGMSDVGRVGFYGLTYKENVDDIRESPTLQMLKTMKRHLCGNFVKVYDPFIDENIVPNQLHNLDQFLSEIDFVVLLVAHNEIIENMDKLRNKIVLDTRKICDLEGAYRL